MNKLINLLVELFGVTSVDRAVKGMTKAMNSLDKVIERQEAKADRMAALAAQAVERSGHANSEALKAKRVKGNLKKLFD